jgi:hypothetical protein
MSTEALGWGPIDADKIHIHRVAIKSGHVEDRSGGVMDSMSETIVGSNHTLRSPHQVDQVTLTWETMRGVALLDSHEQRAGMTIYDDEKRQAMANVDFPAGENLTRDERAHRAVIAFGTAVHHVITVVGNRPMDVLQLNLQETV